MKKFNIDWRWYLWILGLYLIVLPIKPASSLTGWVMSYGIVGAYIYMVEYPLDTIIFPALIFWIIKGAYKLWEKKHE